MKNNIKNLFYPKSICVVGASAREKSIGYEMLHTISHFHYKGIIYPVNPKSESLLGYRSYKSIDEIKDPIDLAILVVPKHSVDCSIDLLIEKGVKSYIVITAGFKETGKEGEEIEKEIAEKVKRAGGRLVGPNCMGVINTHNEIKLNATFVAEEPHSGQTGFLSQSGALGAAVLNSLRETDIKFGHFISVGNKADINENDLLYFWEEDDYIKTLTFYLESFVDGLGFLKPFITGEITKPTIVLKAGKTSSGAKAASSHTGALSSSDKVVNSLLRQFGIIRVNDINEMFNTAKGFENFPIPKGNRIAVVTNAGGPAILAVDTLEENNLALAQLSNETKQKLSEIVLADGSIENPIDLLPGADAAAFRKVIEITAQDQNVDAIISIFVEPVMVRPFDVVESVNEIKSEKPIFQVDMPLPEFWDKYRESSKKHLPVFRNPEDPAPVISNMLFYAESRARMKKTFEEYKELLELKTKTEYDFSPGFLSQQNIYKIADDYKIPILKNRIVTPDKLNSIEQNLFPVVIKGINKKVVHKSEMNAVKLNVKNPEELKAAAIEISKNFKSAGFEVEEFLIQPFIDLKHEVLIGGFRDPSFGPVIMFGAGGKYVEVLNDTAIKSAYLTNYDIDDMIDSTRIGKILKGVRGESSSDIDGLKQIIKSCSKMMIENPNIKEFDINPVLIGKDNKNYVADIRLKWES
ncbi:MAG: acetate--CoA ligase family protein [Melioribacteraceae bacterium]|nr:acetate--CoA ligase family protein [Melioribacteraceae bacterium]